MSSEIHQPAEDAQLYQTYVYPLALFLSFNLLLFVTEAVFKWDHPDVGWWRRAPEMWIYPLQTLVCAGYLFRVRRGIPWDWTWSYCLWGVLAGVVGIAFWLIPYVTGLVPREGGFEPVRIFGASSVAVYGSYLFRFARAALVVPLVEELFWRGFLMRWCINRDFPQLVPIGQGSWLAYGVTTLAFMLIHAPVDYAGAFVYGTLAYGLVIWTKRLMPVVVMHAVANLVMGVCALALDLPHLW